MLLVYTKQVTSRLHYTFNLIFGNLLGITFEVTTDPDRFSKHEGPCLSYLDNPLGNELFFRSDTLLLEQGVHPVEALPEDPFALSFFMATRYEEYLPFTEDRYGRYSAGLSLSYRSGKLHLPLVNLAAEEIGRRLAERFRNLKFRERKFSYLPTIDIDNAYAFRGKNLLRTAAAHLRSAMKLNQQDLMMRKQVLAGKTRDPFDTYDQQFLLHEQYGLKPVYFFLLADWAKNDKNLPHSNPLMKTLVHRISERAETGIHPSFASNRIPSKIALERSRLERMSGKKVTKSRQHFLKLRFPETYRNLIAAGIKEDYTMGYADEVGFRAGLCTPFHFYDLEREQETALIIHPFAVMDGTLNSYLKLSPEQALEKAGAVFNEVRKVNGELITIWHNESLSNWREWEGWNETYEKFIQLAV